MILPPYALGRPTRRMLALACAVAIVAGLAGCRLNPPEGPASTATQTGTVSQTPSAAPTEAAPTSATPTQATTPLGALSGTWDGTWVNATPVAASGTFTLVWAQQGDEFFGALTVEGSNCLTAGNVTGNIVDKKVSFGAVEGSTTIQYDGTVVDRDTIEGTYRSTDCSGVSGTWAAKRRDT